MHSNPYKSPPPDLLAEGISTVMQYVRVRMQRIDRMHKIILERCEQTPPEGGISRCAKTVQSPGATGVWAMVRNCCGLCTDLPSRAPHGILGQMPLRGSRFRGKL